VGSAVVTLPSLPYLRLRAALRAERAARLPPFKGSLLRGAFGHALRRMVCVMGPQQPCPSCSLRGGCVYPRLFVTLIEGEPPPFLRGLSTAPGPYIFEPGEERREFSEGDLLEFDLLLVGAAVELQAYAALAIERMGPGGLGVRRVPFRLESLCYLSGAGSWVEGWDGRRRQWGARASALWTGGEAAGGLPGEATLRFLTPTRIQVRKRPVQEPGFRLLAFQMLRRTLELTHFHAPGAATEWEFQELLREADRVEVEHDLTWRDWERYSNRQQRKMTLGGFVGTMKLRGDLTPFWPLLKTAEVIHVGKGASFGLGRVEVGG
jgi:CRISPR-associated endoribonuclease Cas6